MLKSCWWTMNSHLERIPNMPFSTQQMVTCVWFSHLLGSFILTLCFHIWEGGGEIDFQASSNIPPEKNNFLASHLKKTSYGTRLSNSFVPKPFLSVRKMWVFGVRKADFRNHPIPLLYNVLYSTTLFLIWVFMVSFIAFANLCWLWKYIHWHNTPRHVLHLKH